MSDPAQVPLTAARKLLVDDIAAAIMRYEMAGEAKVTGITIDDRLWLIALSDGSAVVTMTLDQMRREFGTEPSADTDVPLPAAV